MNRITLTLLLTFVISGCTEEVQKLPPPKVVREEPLGVMVDRIAVKFDHPPMMARKMILEESSLNPNALSKTNAVGLAQVLRSTAASECGVKKLHELAHPEVNLTCGFFYLAKLKKRYGTYWSALIAYRSGPGILENPKRNPKLYREGQLYAKRILGV
jgi:soluble lytic murein transglycosylase-like protein